MMNSITRSLNIVTILTKTKIKKFDKNLFFDLCFCQIVTMFKLFVILFIIKY